MFVYFIVATISIILLLGVAVTFYRWRRLQCYNQSPLNIKTFDGRNSPYHPTVLYFKEGWNGYKYWMAETPFSPQCKPYMDRDECPSIHVSNDGINWFEIIKSPIDDLNEQEIKELDFFSDPHLVYANGRLECWYRFTHRKGKANYYDNLQLVRRTSYDGRKWSDREMLVNLATKEGDALGNALVSPAIQYNNGTYRMWFVDSESRTTRNIAYSESTNGYDWTEKKICSLNGSENTPWHIDVNIIDGKYYLLSYNFDNITLWKSEDGLNFSFMKEILKPSVFGSFYGYSLYRACIIKDEKYKVYFSGNDSLNTYIGLLQGEDINNLVFVPNGKHLNLLQLITFQYKFKSRSAKFIIKRILKKLSKNKSVYYNGCI